MMMMIKRQETSETRMAAICCIAVKHTVVWNTVTMTYCNLTDLVFDVCDFGDELLCTLPYLNDRDNLSNIEFWKNPYPD